MWIATLAWALLVLGYRMRKRRAVHIECMLAGITLDILLVLYLQITRQAVQTALEFSLNIFKQIHIGFSSLALVLYIPVVFLGVRLALGQASPAHRQLHMRIGIAALIIRTLGFIFMFSMWRA
ncbi:MAG: hypothetical protein DCC75_04165 [Proteobacteria bacterium]|nr:MAG: hypothetical protein DCC75_04165 [Pseudomonadota bacterium]